MMSQMFDEMNKQICIPGTQNSFRHFRSLRILLLNMCFSKHMIGKKYLNKDLGMQMTQEMQLKIKIYHIAEIKKTPSIKNELF